MTLPVCHSRHSIPGESGTFFCAHPSVHARDHLITPPVCELCSYWSDPPPFKPRPVPDRIVRRGASCFFLGDERGLRECPSCHGRVRQKVFDCRHVLHAETTIAECRDCRDYELPLSVGTVKTWAVGVTTAPREAATLERTLQSLCDAGFSQLRIFAEPDSLIPECFGDCPVTWRESRVGAFPNWYLALAELVMRVPQADAYFLCQDDVQLANGLRQYLEMILWPARSVGAVSVYRAARHPGPADFGFSLGRGGWDTHGALTLIFPNTSARALLAHPFVVNHRHLGPNSGLYNVDDVVGEWCARAGLPYCAHHPSLAFHLGETSTLFPQARAEGIRQAASFLTDLRPYLPLIRNGTPIRGFETVQH